MQPLVRSYFAFSRVILKLFGHVHFWVVPLLVCTLMFPAVVTLAADEATQEAEEEEEATAESVVQKSITAYGGKDALEQIDLLSAVNGKLITTKGSRIEQGYRCARKNGKWRIDLERARSAAVVPPADAANTSAATTSQESDAAPGEKSAAEKNAEKSATDTESASSEVVSFDGQTGWRMVGKDITTLAGTKLDENTDKVSRHPGLLTYWQEPDTALRLLGSTNYKQQRVYTLELSGKGRPNTTFFVDQKNFLVVALAYDVPVLGSEPAKVTVEFSQYRPTGGTLFPCKQVELRDGARVSELLITSASIGAPIEDSLFERPKQEGKFRLARTVEIPFEYADNEIVVKCRLNKGEEVDFLFDTGASDTIIDRRVAAQHFLAKQDKFDIAAFSGMVEANKSELKRFEIGSLVLNNVPVRVLDMNQQSRQMGRPIAGIIGTNIINQFLITIDYSKPNLTFEDLDTAQRPAKAVSVPFVFRQLPYIKVSLNGKDEQLLLVDTGAAFNHLPTSVAERHISGDPANVRHVTEATGLDGRQIQLGRVVVDSVGLGAISKRSVSFTYPMARDRKGTAGKGGKPLPEGKERAGFFQDSNFGILGNPFWENFIVVIDYRFQRLLLVQNPVYKLRNDMDASLNAGDVRLVAHRDYRQSEMLYQKALMLADSSHDVRMQARVLGRLGNLRRIMAKDLNRPEHSKAAYQYFVRAQELAKKSGARDVEGRILADWSLLYSDNGQKIFAKQAIDRAMILAPQDANVNVDCAVHLYRSKLYPEMQRYVEKALFIEPSNWSALWYQVKLSENFSDVPRVVATLKEILRFYPWSKLAQEKLVAAKAASGLPIVTPSSGSVEMISPSSQQSPSQPRQTQWLPKVPSVQPTPKGKGVPTISPWGRPQTHSSVPMITPMKKPLGGSGVTSVPMIVPTKSKEQIR